MARDLNHVEITELLGAYALDAVDGPEADQVERHLQVCPRCQAEVADHREVAAAMASAGGPAPERVWQRIVEGLEEPPPALDLDRVRSLTPRRWSLPAWPVAAVAAAAAVVIAFLGVQVAHQDDRIDRLASATERRTLQAAMNAALFDSQARRVDLRGADGRVFANAVVQPDGTGYLLPEGLPRLPADRTYQLWAKVDARLVSVGVLGPAPDVAAFAVDPGVTMLAVTDEQAGGVVASERPPVMSGVLPA